MTIHDAIIILTQLEYKHGNVQVCADCPNCKQAFEVDKVEIGAPVVKLNGTISSRSDKLKGDPLSLRDNPLK